MPLTRETYRELEDVLGPENIAEDPTVMESYSFNGTMTARAYDRGGRYSPCRPEAVVLPGSTEEVQAVIKICNRRGIRARAFGTGYGGAGTILIENAILLDMRRMNRIIDIDEKNMHVIVEPYVCFAQVQAAVQKVGLNNHVIAAGSQPSFLASMTSVQGTNTQAMSHGWSGRNLLAVEWVLPTGDVLRLGALGSRAGWFSGDGPGPSLRGIMRGSAGGGGGIGVFTKCAAHLHPWPGKEPIKIKGISPNYEAEVPPLVEYLMAEWPTWEKCAEAQYKMGEAGIVMAMHKTAGPGTHGATMMGSNNEFYEEYQKHPEWKLPWISYSIVMFGNDEAEHEYQVKAMNAILEATDGKKIALGNDPMWRSRDYMQMLKMCHVPRTAFRCTGAFACPLQGMESVGHTAMGLSLDKKFREKYDETGQLGDDGTNNMWGVPFEGGHWSIFECGHFYDPGDKDSYASMVDMMNEGEDIGIKTPLGPFLRGTGDEGAKKFGPIRYNYDKWMKKVKMALDPNIAIDGTNYIWPDKN